MKARLIAVSVICLAAVPIAPALADRAETQVSVDSVTQNADGSGHYEGTVKSERGKCVKRRKVTVIHLSDPPFTIGETTTTEEGFWQLNGPLPPNDNEKIKVVVSKKKKCDKASKTYALGQIVSD